jgi:hypothetical protein
VCAGKIMRRERETGGMERAASLLVQKEKRKRRGSHLKKELPDIIDREKENRYRFQNISF